MWDLVYLGWGRRRTSADGQQAGTVPYVDVHALVPQVGAEALHLRRGVEWSARQGEGVHAGGGRERKGHAREREGHARGEEGHVWWREGHARGVAGRGKCTHLGRGMRVAVPSPYCYVTAPYQPLTGPHLPLTAT